MANEGQYYNPIIQAMVANAEQRQRGEQLKAQYQQHQDLMKHQKIQEDLEGKKVDQERQRIENEHEYQTNMVSNATDLLHAHLAQAKNEALDTARKFIAAGGKPGAYQQNAQQVPGPITEGGGLPLKSATPSDQMDIPGYGQVPVNAFKTKEQLEAEAVQHAGAQAGAITTATDTAHEPALDAAAARTRETERLKQVQDQSNRMIEIGKTQEGAERVARIHAAAQASDANIQGGYHLKGLKMMYGDNLDDGSGDNAAYAKKIVDGVFDGKVDPTKLTKQDRNLVSSYTRGTGEVLPTNIKDYNDQLGNVDKIQSVMNLTRNLAMNYSADSPDATAKGNQNVRVGLLGRGHRVEPGSDLDSQINNLKSMSGSLVKTFEGANRGNDVTIARAAIGTFDPNATMQQNMQKVNDHIKLMQGVVKNTLVGQSPDRQNTVLRNRGITDFGAYGANTAKTYKSTATNPQNGHKVGTVDGTNWEDATTGQPIVQPKQD